MDDVCTTPRYYFHTKLEFKSASCSQLYFTSTGEIYSFMMLQGDQVVCDDEFHTEDADEVGTGKNSPTTLI